MAAPHSPQTSGPARARRRLPGWTYVSIPVGLIALLIALKQVVHPWSARLLFTTWALSAAQVYLVSAAAVALAVVAWFELDRRRLLWSSSPRAAWARAGAVVCTVPAVMLVQLPNRYSGQRGADRVIRELGYELGTTELAVGLTFLAAAIPTVALCIGLNWWISGHRGRVAVAYGALALWMAAVAVTGWALGRP